MDRTEPEEKETKAIKEVDDITQYVDTVNNKCR